MTGITIMDPQPSTSIATTSYATITQSKSKPMHNTIIKPTQTVPKKENAIILERKQAEFADHIIALEQVINLNEITDAYPLRNNRICVFLKHKQLVEELIASNPQIKVNNQLSNIRRYVNPQKKIIIFAPAFITNEEIKQALINNNIKITAPVIQIKLSNPKLAHINSGKRTTFIEEQNSIPDFITIKKETEDVKISLVSEFCNNCHRYGHTNINCRSSPVNTRGQQQLTAMPVENTSLTDKIQNTTSTENPEINNQKNKKRQHSTSHSDLNTENEEEKYMHELVHLQSEPKQTEKENNENIHTSTNEINTKSKKHVLQKENKENETKEEGPEFAIPKSSKVQGVDSDITDLESDATTNSESSWIKDNPKVGRKKLKRAKANKEDSCKLPAESVLYLHNLNESMALSPCPNGYEYNRSVFHSTIITEWDLVCDNGRLAELSQIIIMSGILVGNIIFGITADKHGRKSSLIVAILMQTACSLLSAVVPWFWMFNVLRFLLGISLGGTLVISFVLCMEALGGKYRTIVPILYQIPYGLGSFTMAVFGYFIRDWRTLQLTFSTISVVFVTYYWFCTESPRWLLAVGRRKDASLVLEKAARTNGKSEAEIIRDIIKQEALLENQSPIKSEKEGKTGQLIDLFKIPELRRRTILLYFQWIITGMTFFGFSLHLNAVSKNTWLALGTSGLSLIPGTLICIAIVEVFGRRNSLFASKLLVGFTLIGLQLVPSDVNWAKLTLVAISATSMAISVPALSLYTVELFPTVVRNAGYGTCSMFTRVGSFLSPLILLWGKNAPENLSEVNWIKSPPILIVLAALSIFQALLIIPLPETKNKPLPDTLEEAIGYDTKDVNQNEEL